MIRNALAAGGALSGLTAPTYEPSGAGISGPLTGAQGATGAPGSVNEAAFNRAIEQLIAAAPGSVSISSGKRDRARQEQLWQQALDKYGSESAARKWVAPPSGTVMSDGSIAKGSRHEVGLAADLKFADDAVRQWVHQNAGKFGLHFPLSNEPWHIEILGSR